MLLRVVASEFTPHSKRLVKSPANYNNQHLACMNCFTQVLCVRTADGIWHFAPFLLWATITKTTTKQEISKRVKPTALQIAQHKLKQRQQQQPHSPFTFQHGIATLHLQHNNFERLKLSLLSELCHCVDPTGRIGSKLMSLKWSLNMRVCMKSHV